MSVRSFFAAPARIFAGTMLWLLAAGFATANAATLSGHVSDAVAGTPLANVYVIAYSGYPPLPVTYTTTTTDALGNYSFTFNCEFQCRVGASAAGYLEQTVSYLPWQTSVVIDLQFVREATVAGSVVLPQGYSVDLSKLAFERYDTASGSWSAAGKPVDAVSDEGYRVRQLEAGTYRACYDQAPLLRQCFDGRNQGPTATFDFTPIVVAAGDTRNEVNLAPVAGSSIGGRFTDRYGSGTSVAASITLYDVNGEELPRRMLATVDGQGNYSLAGVAPGVYYVVARNGTYLSRIFPDVDCDTDCNPLLGDLVTVPANGSAANVDFGLQPFAVMRARLRDRETGADIADARFGPWSLIIGPRVSLPNWYDAASGEYVAYMERVGNNVGASAMFYTPHFIGVGDCPDIAACMRASAGVAVQPGEVRHVELTMLRTEFYVFSSGFE